MKSFGYFSYLTFFCCCVFVNVAGKFHSKHLPSYITPCSRNDPTVSECGRKSAQAAIQFLIKGDEEYKIPVLSPLKLPKLEIKSGDNLQLTLTDINIYGIEGVKIDKVSFDTRALHVDTTLSGSYLSVVSQYTITGHILVLPISGSGQANLTFYDDIIHYSWDYEVYKGDDGKEYSRITKTYTDIDITRAYFHLDNLFNGNKQLGDHMNQFLNENSKDVIKDLAYPIMTEIVQLVASQTLKAIIEVVPYDELLPE